MIGKTIECANCNLAFYAAGWDIARGRKYCSHKCSEVGTGFYVTDKGYRRTLAKGHPRADRYGFVLEHIVVAEKTIGRSLRSGEVVHHIDGNKLNNLATNLRVFPNQSEHIKHHQIWAYEGPRGQRRITA